MGVIQIDDIFLCTIKINETDKGALLASRNARGQTVLGLADSAYLHSASRLYATIRFVEFVSRKEEVLMSAQLRRYTSADKVTVEQFEVTSAKSSGV